MIKQLQRHWQLLVILTALLFLSARPTIVDAAQPSATDACIPIGTAGNQTVYRCEDLEVGKLVYVNNYGFLFVVEE